MIAGSGRRSHHEISSNPIGSSDDLCHSSAMELAVRPATQPQTAVVDPNVNRLRNLVYRSLVGAGLVLLPTIINMALLFKWKGKEQGWLCFTICTIDGKSRQV